MKKKEAPFEKVAIMIVSYAIGFITAFIAYGIGTHSTIMPADNEQEAFTAPVQAEEIVPEDVSILTDDSGLYVHTSKGSQMLSANRAPLLSANVISANDHVSGMHYKIIDAELSRNKQYVYFCEQLQETDSTCDPYVYDIAQDVLFVVTLDGEAYYPEIETHVSSWVRGELLTVNDYISIDGREPWKLILR